MIFYCRMPINLVQMFHARNGLNNVLKRVLYALLTCLFLITLLEGASLPKAEVVSPDTVEAPAIQKPTSKVRHEFFQNENFVNIISLSLIFLITNLGNNLHIHKKS